jgi:hypothetical protein
MFNFVTSNSCVVRNSHHKSAAEEAAGPYNNIVARV